MDEQTLGERDLKSTPIFLAAYKNGTGLYWFNRGEAEGYYNIHLTASEKKNHDYMRGWIRLC
jgi:hypothetical protein